MKSRNCLILLMSILVLSSCSSGEGISDFTPFGTYFWVIKLEAPKKRFKIDEPQELKLYYAHDYIYYGSDSDDIENSSVLFIITANNYRENEEIIFEKTMPMIDFLAPENKVGHTSSLVFFDIPIFTSYFTVTIDFSKIDRGDNYLLNSTLYYGNDEEISNYRTKSTLSSYKRCSFSIHIENGFVSIER